MAVPKAMVVFSSTLKTTGFLRQVFLPAAVFVLAILGGALEDDRNVDKFLGVVKKLKHHWHHDLILPSLE